jgi:pilus assembly protein CpaF
VRAERAAAPVVPPAAAPAHSEQPPATPSDDTFKYRHVLQNKLVEAFDVRRTDTHLMSDDELHRLTEQLIADLIGKMTDLPASVDRQKLLNEVRDEAIGLGPLEPMLADASITEIMVNRSDEVFVERLGKLERWPVSFTSDRAVQGIIERIVAPIGRRIDESSPMVDARLKDGSRVNAVIPPLALKGPSITIRKFSKRKLDSGDLLKFGSASPAMIEFMRVCVEQRKNVLISGGTGSGKTTLLNIMSNFIPRDERIVTIEDAAELQLHHPNLVSLEARPPNIEGKGNVPIRDLVKNSLRMRPDRIVVGECRGGEALDMLQAMNTGHDGSLTTAHANSPRDMLARLEVMVLMAGMDLPVTAIREQVASAIDIVVQQTRFACGTRKVTSITEITGVESGRIQLQEVFAFVRNGVDESGRTKGHFTGRGFVPEFYEELKSIGVPLDLDIFHDGMKAEDAGATQSNRH